MEYVLHLGEFMFWNFTAWALAMRLEMEEGTYLGRTHAKWL